MRRTRTGFFNKEQKFKKGVSNLKEFEGEDFSTLLLLKLLEYASRNKFLK
jgi:hypothetical protein